MVRSLSLEGKLTKLLNSSGPRIMVCQKSPALCGRMLTLYAGTAPTGASASSLLTCGSGQLEKLELHGAEPTAMLKTMLSTGSKVANSALVGAAPAIKCHWPRWGSGNWRDKEGNRRRWVSLQNPTSSSVRMTILRDEGVGCLFPAKDWIRDKESLNDFSSCSSSSKPHSPVLHVSTLMAIVLTYILTYCFHHHNTHPFFLPVWLSGHAGPLTPSPSEPPQPQLSSFHAQCIPLSHPLLQLSVGLCSGHW